MDDRSPQLLISQYTCASIRKRANTQACAHRHTSNSTSVFLKIYSVAQKQTLCWSDRLRNILRRDSTLLEQLHEDSSLMLQMHFQFESNQKDLFFPRRHYYYFMWVNLWVIERGRRRINRKANKKQVWYSILQWNLIFLSKGLFCASRGPWQQHYWTCFGPSPPYYLQFWIRRNPGRPSKQSLETFALFLSLPISLIGYLSLFHSSLWYSEDGLLLHCLGQKAQDKSWALRKNLFINATFHDRSTVLHPWKVWQ